MMSRFRVAGAVALVALAAACDGSAPTQPSAATKVKSGSDEVVSLGASASLGCPGATVQIRGVIAAVGQINGTFGPGDKFWSRSTSTLFNCGNKYFEDYLLIVPAGKTTSVDMYGRAGGRPTTWLNDAYIYLYDFATRTYVDRNDDGGIGYNSYLVIDNRESTTAKRFVLRVTAFDDADPEANEGVGRWQVVVSTPARYLEEED